MEPSGSQLDLCRRKLNQFFLARGAGHQSEDLASETIVRVLGKARSGEAIDNIFAFALGVARLVLFEFFRKNSASGTVDADINQLTLTTPEPDSVLEQRHVCLEKCLLKLSLSQRGLLRGSYWDDVSSKGLASGLNTSANAVLIRLHKIRKELKRCLEQCMDEMETP